MGEGSCVFDDLAEKAKPEGGFLAIFEVCGINPWLLEMFQQYGCRETVVIQPTERVKQKTDRRDAGKLGHLLWVHRQQFLEGKHPHGLRRVQPPAARFRGKCCKNNFSPFCPTRPTGVNFAA